MKQLTCSNQWFHWRCICVLICLAVPCFFVQHSIAQENQLGGELSWKNGDKIPGHVVSGSPSHLKWQAELFRDPINVDLTYLDQVKLNSNTLWGKTTETYSIQTIDGFSLFGEITKLDQRWLYVSSSRFGDVEIDRNQVATILNLRTSGSLINGEFDLDKWDASRNEKKYWRVNDQGQLESLRRNVHLFMKTELPESALIEMELEWEKKLDFTFGFGVPRNSRKIESLPRLESWDDSIVLSYNDDFEIVMESTDGDSKRLKFLIHWNRTENKLVIHDEKGKQLATADLGKPSANVDPGIYLENKSGDLKVNSLMIRRSATGFNATEPSIQTLDEAAINGQVQSFDGTDWVVSTSDRGEEEGSQERIPKDTFCGAFLMNPSKSRTVGQTRLKFHDGMYVGGEFVSVTGDLVSIRSEFAEDPVSYKLAGAAHLRFDASKSNKVAEGFKQRLFNSAGEIQGRLEKGSGGKDDILRWRVAGAESAVALSRGDARIVLREKQAIVAVDDEWADTLYLTNRDTIPCRVVAIDEQHVTIESFTENKKIDQRLIKAVDLRNQSIAESINPNDDEWVIPAASTKRLKISNTKMQVSKEAEFGHPWLLSSGGFEFDLAWKNNSYGVLECTALVGDLGSDDSGKKINIMLYGQNLFVANPGDQNPNNGMIAAGNGKANIAFKFSNGKMLVNVNGKKAYSERVPSSLNRGRGVRFRLLDMHQQNISCSLSNFKLIFSDTGNGILVDPDRRDLLLTIPRLKKQNPPNQILCATNGDMLRGDLVSMDDQFVMFRANNEVKRYPRDIVTSVVWLHAEKLAQLDSEPDSNSEANGETGGSEPNGETENTTAMSDSDAAEKTLVSISENPSNDESKDSFGQTVQILMQGGRRMTSVLDSWTDDKLTGASAALGNCQIPFDQIYELRFGDFAEKATDVPYADWVASIAPAPRMEIGADGEQGTGFTFGSASPLIGTTPKSFTAAMVGGEKFSLGSQAGKVVVLDFWATWCGPCVQALPIIEETIAQYPSDRVTLLAVNQEETLEQIEKFLLSRELNIPVALDSGKIGQQFQVKSLPKTVIIDQDGNIAFVKVGHSSDLKKKLKAAIDLLLADDDGDKNKVF